MLLLSVEEEHVRPRGLTNHLHTIALKGSAGGYETSAEAMASPYGKSIGARLRSSKKLEDERVQEVNERNERAREELKSRARTSRFGEHFLGRELQFALPRPVSTINGCMPIQFQCSFSRVLSLGAGFDSLYGDD